MSSQNVAILGASENKERYAYMAFHLLKDKGHVVVPINPRLKAIEGHRCYGSLSEVKDIFKTSIHTLTVYVAPNISSDLKDEIIALRPGRVIFNPGSENVWLEGELAKVGIGTLHACTLVLLRTNQF